jgi:serine/threonine-protein kinase ATR
MAADSYGRAGQHGYINIANGAGHGGPPPSTLAAQLVENISTTTTSSRPDETQELKRLFVEIERVKNQADVPKTLEEQVDNNHTLIYVYSRVALDNLKWDNPFTDQDVLTSEVLKAINFLKITIKETPDVLDHTISDGTFLFRGQEPLWLWILPKVLRLLGNSRCLPLVPAIEDFCGFLLLISGQNKASAHRLKLIATYLQGVVQGLPSQRASDARIAD